MWQSIILVSMGAATGGVLRWMLGILLAQCTIGVITGVMVANWLGCLLMGMVLAICSHVLPMSAELRLLLVTGFLGGLTTFSGFAAEIYLLVEKNQWVVGSGVLMLHLLGSAVALLLGIALVVGLKIIFN